MLGHCRNKAVKVEFVEDGVDPETLVRKASKHRELRSNDYDEVWCVVDVDDYDLDPARKLARERGIRLAVSNPCFEYWLLLHFEEYLERCRNYAEVERRLRRHLPAYDKTRLSFADYVDGLDAAVRRARARCDHEREHLNNPSTGVWPLVESMRPSRGG